mgnify:CR=1 FL=1
MQNYQPTQGYDGEIGFDGTIEQDAQEFIVLQPGEHEFTVKSIEKGRFNGSQKADGLPPCNMVKVSLEINSNQGTAIVFDNIYLHTRVEWRISSFFGAIGQKKKGEPLRMNWNSVIGQKGKAKIVNNEYNGNTYNNVASYVLPDDYDQPVQTQMQGMQGGWKPGQF